jgi:hypothetical protein
VRVGSRARARVARLASRSRGVGGEARAATGLHVGVVVHDNGDENHGTAWPRDFG